MIGFQRAPILVLGALVGALAICMVLPAVDAGCAMSGGPARALGTCGIGQPGSRGIAILGLLFGAIVAVILLGSIAIHAALHHRVSRGLGRQARPAVVAEQAVGLVPGVGAALVAGIRHPRIYCSDDLVVLLDAEELQAVLLHERHHELAHAPARLVVLTALAPFLGLFGQGSAWIDRQRAGIEIAADEHAVRHGATGATLARAILKLRDSQSRASLAGFATAGDLRLRALLGEDIGSAASRPGAVGTAVVAAVAVAVLCSVFSLL